MKNYIQKIIFVCSGLFVIAGVFVLFRVEHVNASTAQHRQVKRGINEVLSKSME